MRENLGKAMALALALAACGPTPRDPGTTPDGSGGGVVDGNTSTGDSSPTGDGCSDEAKLVYVVDQNRKLSQFHPQTKTFTDLGTLSCQPSSSATPFSMAIARDATAWVLYNNGELFRVETKNNLACTKAAWTPNTAGLKVFGMGFSTDQVGGTTDTLFISGGSSTTTSTSTLARLDMSTFQPTTAGTVTGWPELTGTGKAELWGFFPSTSNARIVQLDKAGGGVLQTYPLSLAGDPRAWAFAFHGGSFWVFLKKGSESYTTVYQVNSMTGALVGQTEATGRSIVGAGVSTCAPIIL
ncbi:MAG TPA: hypothetical protein VK932_21500 [Kofleriaceae bacterium]|nr:hypothetical protein [Kofleriaceae bacterium]